MTDYIDKFNYYKKLLDKAISKIDIYLLKDNITEDESYKLSKLIHNAEYFVLICQIYKKLITKSNI